jgi:hypothetical protein
MRRAIQMDCSGGNREPDALFVEFFLDPQIYYLMDIHIFVVIAANS